MYSKKSFLNFLLVYLFLQVLCVSPASADDWIKNIDDNTFVSQLSIPGTHDSGTGHGFSVGDIASAIAEYLGRTQEKNITEQWNCGIRCFDLRPAVDGSSLYVFHGIAKTNLSFSTAMSTLSNLVGNHPKEFAIVIIRHEKEGDNNSSLWKDKMSSLLGSISDRIVNFSPMMKVKDARGKILILSRDEYRSIPYGGYIYDWSNFTENAKIKRSGNEAPCSIQDYYDCTGSSGKSTKNDKIKSMLNKSMNENTDPNRWFINHTSGYSKTINVLGKTIVTNDGYRENAAYQNSRVVDYLSSHYGSTGIVVMDYAGVDKSGDYQTKGQKLINAVINNNSKEGPNSAYFRALSSIEPGAKYRIYTKVNDKKYYMEASGSLTSKSSKAGTFTFSRVEANNTEYKYGFNLLDAYFTNPALSGSNIVNNGQINTDLVSKRKDWEAQVFFLKSGKYAIRATNAKGGNSGWGIAAKTFWSVDTSSSSPKPKYTFSQDYIWQLEKTSSTTRVADLDSDGGAELTGISEPVNHQPKDNQVYDLMGRRVSNAGKGIYIVNGRKVVK